MTTNLQDITWQSMDDVLETRNENGHLTANILFTEGTPTIEDMDGFKRVLCFVKGKVRGGISNIGRTEVFLTEENNYSEIHSAGNIVGEYEMVGLDTELIGFSLDENGVTISKSPYLTSPGTYTTTFAFFGEDWAEIFVVQIVVTVPLRITHSGTNYSTHHTHGQTITLDLTAANAPQYLRVYGSRPWTLEGVDPSKINVSPLLGEGSEWYYDTITVNPAGNITEPKQTTFRILAQTRWVDIVVNLRLPLTFNFVPPREGEAGAPAGTDPVYIYI